MILLNYFPCSYGDTLVAMFCNFKLQRKNSVAINPIALLKLQNFYSLSLEEKKQQWPSIKQYPVVACHRQKEFDFNQIEPVKVISIKINQREWLYNRVKAVQWKYYGQDVGDPILKQLKTRLSDKDQNLIIEKDYQMWAQSNILPSDEILDFEMLLDNSIIDWCNQRQLNVDPNILEIIRQDILKYQ